MIDTHAHLFEDRFADDLPAVIARATAVGIESIICIGLDRITSLASIDLANRYPMVFAAVGIQPNHVADAQAGDWEAIEQLAESTPRVVAIGETGLDRYWDRAPFALQLDYFNRHIALARRLNKPFVIHCRDAEADVVAVLRADFERHGPIRAVMHSFSGDMATAKSCLEMGLAISFAGMVTYKNAAKLRDVAREVPLDRLLIETDCPYLAPVPLRGKRNEPAFVVHTAACLAEVKGVTVADLGLATTGNARKLFGVL